MTKSELSLINKLLERIEEKNEKITQLKLDHQKENWQKQLIIVERDMEVICHELSHHKNITDKVKTVMKRQMFNSMKSCPSV